MQWQRSAFFFLASDGAKCANIHQLLNEWTLSIASWCTKHRWKHCMAFHIEPSLEMIIAFRGISRFLLIRHLPHFFLYTNSHSLALPSCSLCDVRAVAVLTVADKIGQLRHLREWLLACEKHVRILHSMAQGFSCLVYVFFHLRKWIWTGSW